MTLISFCSKLTQATNITNIDLEIVLDQIRTEDTELLKKVRAGDKKAKLDLPCLIFAGTFSKRASTALIEPSGYMILDFDKVENPAQFRDNIFNNNTFVRASFISPTGTGVKALVKIPKTSSQDEFRVIFKSLNKEFANLDKGDDLARVCFMSYDPEIKVRETPDTYIPTTPTIFDETVITEQLSENEIVDKLLVWAKKKYTFGEGQRNNALYALSCSLFRYGVEDHKQILINLNTGVSDQEITQLYNSADKSTSHNSVVFEPKKVKVSRPVLTTKTDTDKYIIDYAILDYKDIKAIITDELHHTIRVNEITKRLEFDGNPITDREEICLYSELDSFIRKSGFSKKSPKKDIFNGALSELAKISYNPIKEKLETTNWDGIKRLDELCLCLKDQNNVGSSYMYHFILGAIERLYYGYQNPILVLDGQQKIGKSSLVNFLGSSFKKYYVADGSLDPESKDDKLALCENFIYNWEEGASFSKRQMEAVKSLVFSDNQRIRRPYAKYDEDYKVNASIIMPKNQGEFLTDVTGNRRYNIVQLDTIDYSYSKFDPDQIWAEAYSTWINDTEKLWQKFDTEKRDRINESMMITPAIYDILDEVIQKSNNETDFVSNTDLYNELQRRDTKFDRNKMTKVISNYARTNLITQEKRRGVRGFVGINIDVKPYNY